MRYSLVSVKFHWGFQSHQPEKNRVKSTLMIPPPTTLIGALLYYLDYGVEVISESGSSYFPMDSRTDKILASASYIPGDDSINDEDYGKNLHIFSTPIKNTVINYVRTGNMQTIRTNIIAEEKILYPQGKMDILYIFKEDYDEDLILRMSSSIQRVGSKESIVSVESVKTGEAILIENQSEIKTRFYFSQKMGEPVETTKAKNYIVSNFWVSSHRQKNIIKENFVIPNYGILSTHREKVSVRPLGECYRVGDEYAIFY